jgi:hypothetical protein
VDNLRHVEEGHFVAKQIYHHQFQYVRSRTFTSKQENKLTQISATVNQEALFEVITVYPDFYWNVLYKIQHGTGKSVLPNKDFAGMPITEHVDPHKSNNVGRHLLRIKTICKVLIDRMFSTRYFSKMLPDGSPRWTESIIGTHHKSWIENQVLPKHLKGKL